MEGTICVTPGCAIAVGYVVYIGGRPPIGRYVGAPVGTPVMDMTGTCGIAGGIWAKANGGGILS